MREHARYPCRVQVRIRIPGQGEFEGEMTDAGMGGALIRVRRAIEGAEADVLIPHEQEDVLIRSRVVRKIHSGQGVWLYGVEFEPHFSERPKLAAIVDKLRRR